MRDRKLVWLLVLSVVIFVSGCAKKSSEQTNIPATGFDSGTATPATTSEELSQLPQAATTASQQSSVEALPVEAAPVTQSAATAAATPELPSAKGLSHDMEIQTALKNAGLYNGKVDGKLGPASKKAIAEFQKQNGLKADGKVGPKTWAALSTHLSGATAAPAAAAADTATPAQQ